MGRAFRVFQSQQLSLMLTLLKSLAIPLLEYCYQLWNPWIAKDIQAIEAMQRTLTCKIIEGQHLNYLEWLHELKLYSLQRRLNVIYNYTYLEYNTDMVPNIDGTMGHKIETRKHKGIVTQCVIQYPTNRNPAQFLQENAITVFGPRLYNSFQNIWATSKCLNWKIQIWARQISRVHSWWAQNAASMSPQQETLASSTSNLIWGLKEFTKVVVSLTRPRSSLSCFETTESIQVSKKVRKRNGKYKMKKTLKIEMAQMKKII